LANLRRLIKNSWGRGSARKLSWMWERANGQSNRVLKLIRPPESFAETFEFENEIETAEPLLFILRRFLEQLAIRLGTIISLQKNWCCESRLPNKQIYERVFKIPQPNQ
jgi:protein ImuB